MVVVGSQAVLVRRPPKWSTRFELTKRSSLRAELLNRHELASDPASLPSSPLLEQPSLSGFAMNLYFGAAAFVSSLPSCRLSSVARLSSR